MCNAVSVIALIFKHILTPKTTKSASRHRTYTFYAEQHLSSAACRVAPMIVSVLHFGYHSLRAMFVYLLWFTGILYSYGADECANACGDLSIFDHNVFGDVMGYLAVFFTETKAYHFERLSVTKTSKIL